MLPQFSGGRLGVSDASGFDIGYAFVGDATKLSSCSFEAQTLIDFGRHGNKGFLPVFRYDYRILCGMHRFGEGGGILHISDGSANRPGLFFSQCLAVSAYPIIMGLRQCWLGTCARKKTSG